ncbi:MAG: RHS repeat-associated core domain-containing protein [Lysobacterales bacterium]
MDNTGSTDLAPDTVLVSDASYAPFGPVTGVRNGLQKRLTRGLDLNYAPTAIDSETPGGLGLRYTMDEVGNISRLASAASGRSAPRLDLEYDPLQRLTGAYAANGHGQAFGYTATGDRSEIAEVGFGPILPVDYAYAPGTHRLVAVGATARSVDAAGNTTSRGDGVGLAYDARNRLTQVTLPGGNTRYTYLYNGKGERVGKKKTLAGSPVGASYFVYDEGGRLLGEYTASGAAVAEYLYFNDALYAVATPTDLYYVETDHLGTPRTLVSSARQTVVWSWDALDAKGAFGASAPDADPDHDGVPMVFNLRFPGQYFDQETGLNYNYFRDYEPGTGRYIESDPIGLFGGLSTYGYAFEGPLNFSDPLGLVSDAQCCRGAQAQVLAETANARGFVACCGGKRVSCTIDDPYDSDAAANAKRSCRLKHEDSHNADTTRCLCQGDGQPTGAAPPPPGSGPNNPNQYGSECDAYSVSLPCFIDKLKGCQQSRDAGCVNSLKAELVNQRNQYQKFCGRKPPV